MTLDTRIAILSPVDLTDLHKFVNKNLLLIRDDEACETYDKLDENLDWEHFKATEERRWVPNKEGLKRLGNRIGQGFDAIFEVTYREDGNLYDAPQYYDDDYELTEFQGLDDDGEPKKIVKPAMWAEISFDTSYALKDSRLGPKSCGDLHAAFILLLHQWLKKHGSDILWYNEFEGEWYEGIDNLSSLYSGSKNASEWFDNTVMAVIASGIMT